MDLKKSTILIFFVMSSFLCVMSFCSGCLQIGNPVPLDVTIHSAYKTTEIGGQASKSGTFFIVVNMTVENRGDKTYRFDNKSAVITNGKLLNPPMFAKITHHGYWGPIPPHAKRTGEVIFGTSEDTQDFTITFLYNNGKDSFDKEIGSIPMRPISDSQNTEDNTLNGGNTRLLNVTIHSAYKTPKIEDSKPYTGRIFVVTNMTIENLGDTDYSFAEDRVRITGGGPLTQKLYEVLTNPFYWSSIPAHEKKTGEVVFSVDESTQHITITFLNDNKQVINTQDIGSIPEVG